MPVVFTDKQIRTAIEVVKDNRFNGHHYGIYEKQPAINDLIWQDYKRILIKNERFTTQDFITIIYFLFLNEFEVLPNITYYDVKIRLDEIIKKDYRNDYLTQCEELEDYMKIVIHANEFIRLKSVDICIYLMCAYINTLDSATANCKRIEVNLT